MRKRSFSIIIPTYGREQELYLFIESVINQQYDLKLLELIIVDQNDTIDIRKPLEKYKQHISLLYIHSEIKGIAKAKNTGLDHASHEIVTFADDDSLYYPDTISAANAYFETNPDIEIFYGKVYDREKGHNVIRNWKAKPLKITKFNYHLNYIAIACFSRIKSIRFDERFGVGTLYGMGEELDYLLQSLNNRHNVWYTPTVEVWHPEINVFTMTEQKVFYYATGYGAICKKHRSPVMLWNLVASCSYQFITMCVLFAVLKTNSARRRYMALAGRMQGYVKFKR